MASRTPSLRRRRLARALRNLRDNAGLNLDQVVEQIEEDFSKAKLSRIESAIIGINGDDTYALCRFYGVSKKMTDSLVSLARHAKQRGWWAVYADDILGNAVDLLELESDATRVQHFGVDVVPGLLQTEAYARTVIEQGRPTDTRDEIASRVEIRMARQQRLRDRALEHWAIIDEAALRRPIGSHVVMAEQIAALLDWSHHPQVSVQVIPLECAGHAALGVPFIVFTLDDGAEYVYVDMPTGGLWIEDETEVKASNVTFQRLAAQALNFEQSKRRLREVADHHASKAKESGVRPLRMAKK